MYSIFVKSCASVFPNPNMAREIFWLLNGNGRHKGGSEGLTQGEYPWKPVPLGQTVMSPLGYIT